MISLKNVLLTILNTYMEKRRTDSYISLYIESLALYVIKSVPITGLLGKSKCEANHITDGQTAAANCVANLNTVT